MQHDLIAAYCYSPVWRFITRHIQGHKHIGGVNVELTTLCNTAEQANKNDERETD